METSTSPAETLASRPTPPPGWSPPTGRSFYRPHPAEALASELKRQARRQIIIGTVVAVAGLVITLVAFISASPGGHFVVLRGAVIFGTVRAIRGAIRYNRAEVNAARSVVGDSSRG